MDSRTKKNIIIAFAFIFTFVGIIVPIQVSGKVKQITDVEDKLEGISEEEKKVLEELFTINQKIEELESEKEQINKEISTLQKQINDLGDEIKAKQEDYDLQLNVLEQVLVNYQRGGPATYLEILLKAEDFSTFLKSINTIKDISHNVNELLGSLADGKKVLQEEKVKLDEKAKQLNQKETELSENLHSNELLQEEKETYLAALQEDKEYYTEQLDNLETMWKNCQALFPKLAKELTDTINGGYFTMEDMNIEFGFLDIKGFIKEDTFNQIMQENSELTDTTFKFAKNQVIIGLPKEHLVLAGNFMITDQSSIKFVVEEGSFYDIPLEEASIEELLQEGPLVIDFKLVSEGLITIEFIVTKVECQEGKLVYEVKPKW